MANTTVGRMPGGPKYGGRQKGTPNRPTKDIAEKLAKLNCDPITGLALIAMNKLPCAVCRGKGKTKAKLENGTVSERQCQSCWGSLMESVSPETILKAYTELAGYIHSKRKAIEYSGPDGGPIGMKVELVFVGTAGDTAYAGD